MEGAMLVQALLLFIGVIVILAFFFMALFLPWLIAPRITKYRIEDTGISVIDFSVIRSRFIPFSNIASISVTSISQMLDTAFSDNNFGGIDINRFNDREMVRIELKNRRLLTRYVVISPENPCAFIEEVKQHLTLPEQH
jgi:hypothetical protein